MESIIIKKISPNDVERLSSIYKEVFSGFPWYEERICSASLSTNEDEICNVQYTSRLIPADYKWPLNKMERRGVVGNSENLESCVLCGKPLIDFYPSFVNQDELITEALMKPGFIGYMLEYNQIPFGFSWGYKVPTNTRTKSVNFPLIAPLLDSSGIHIEKTFYGAELGIIETKQGSGRGLLASAVRLNGARLADYKDFVVRTKNEKVLSILRRIFSGQKEKLLFNDPERNAPWYAWKFEYFDVEKISTLLSTIIEE
ncbi:hypothetical protein J4456_04250 [Candidatus Pacearchaeota archaeon]|nr:hypothetical protein [uncultured archaeon]AQS29440.1 hypothetical protein [uncultured archaeon]AQS34068.1 hypothetical protein [uncultured archaeon]MBS3093760.1 hypothetical protein [Candidatus Pacearchaeota archaeon]